MSDWAEATTLPLPHDLPVDFDVSEELARYWESQTADHRAAVERILAEDA